MKVRFSTITWLAQSLERDLRIAKGREWASFEYGILSGVTRGAIHFSRGGLMVEAGRDLQSRLELIGGRLTGVDEQEAKRRVVKKVKEFVVLVNTSLQSDPLFVVEVMLKALQLYDYPTYQHQLRVADLCAKVGEELGVSEDELVDLTVAASLHDFGKIGLSHPVLYETQPWSEEKRQTMGKIHLQITLAVAGAIHSLRDTARIIRYNHYYEGYPDGIEKETVPLEGQILSAVDCFDAWTSPRPSRGGAARNKERALGEIEERSRSKSVATPYDPQLVCALRKLVLSPSHPA